MTRPNAELLAGALFPAHVEAAAPLIVQATDPQPSETRERAHRALRFLDPDEPLIPEPAWSLAGAVGYLVLGQLYLTDRGERARIGGLLDAALREAARVRQRFQRPA